MGWFKIDCNSIFIIVLLLGCCLAQADDSQAYGHTYPTKIPAYVGSTVRIKCHSFKKPVWLKVNGFLNQPDIFTATLVLRKVTEEDTGTYACKGTINKTTPFMATSDVYVGGTKKLLIVLK